MALPPELPRAGAAPPEGARDAVDGADAEGRDAGAVRWICAVDGRDIDGARATARPEACGE